MNLSPVLFSTQPVWFGIHVFDCDDDSASIDILSLDLTESVIDYLKGPDGWRTAEQVLRAWPTLQGRIDVIGVWMARYNGLAFSPCDYEAGYSESVTKALDGAVLPSLWLRVRADITDPEGVRAIDGQWLPVAMCPIGLEADIYKASVKSISRLHGTPGGLFLRSGLADGDQTPKANPCRIMSLNPNGRVDVIEVRISPEGEPERWLDVYLPMWPREFTLPEGEMVAPVRSKTHWKAHKITNTNRTYLKLARAADEDYLKACPRTPKSKDRFEYFKARFMLIAKEVATEGQNFPPYTTWHGWMVNGFK